MDLQQAIRQSQKCKILHLEAWEGNQIYVGAGIKANSLEEAEKIMKAVFLGSGLTDVEIYCIEEHWLN